MSYLYLAIVCVLVLGVAVYLVFTLGKLAPRMAEDASSRDAAVVKLKGRVGRLVKLQVDFFGGPVRFITLCFAEDRPRGGHLLLDPEHSLVVMDERTNTAKLIPDPEIEFSPDQVWIIEHFFVQYGRKYLRNE